MKKAGIWTIFIVLFFGTPALAILPENINIIKDITEQVATYKEHGVAMHGDLKYGPDFKHFEYVNPNAPKGGKLKMYSIGTFNSFNAYIIKGVPPAGITLLNDTLMVHASDEPFSEYGLVAETIEFPKDRSWVSFVIRPEARFHDGSRITPEDVAFSMDILKEVHPGYAYYYRDVVRSEVIEQSIKFYFREVGNRELPLIVGQLPVFSKKYWEGKKFNKTSLKAPLGSGPYKIDSYKAGRSITYNRVKDWWAKDLPVNNGRYNWDIIQFKYFRDHTVALEAFLAKKYDFRYENTSKLWKTGYDSPAVRENKIIKIEIPDKNPQGMQALVFNTRKKFFQDRKTREALGYAFNFEWLNKEYMFGAYKRTRSYFSNSEMAARGLPGADELRVLEPFRDNIPSEVFSREYNPPSTDGSGKIRNNLRKAYKLLKEAGWKIDKESKKLFHSDLGIMRFEILLNGPSFEKHALAFVANLKKLGITVVVSPVDTSQHRNRLNAFDFDMVISTFGQSNSPGNEQRNYWSSASADRAGSGNLIGITDPVIDILIERIISAPDRKSLVTYVKALDRVLLWGHYVIPQWHNDKYRIAYWDKFGSPDIKPKYDLGFFDTWWIDVLKEGKLKK